MVRDYSVNLSQFLARFLGKVGDSGYDQSNN